VWCTLAFIDSHVDFVTAPAIRVHDPQVGIFHCGFRRGQFPIRALIGNSLSVRRPGPAILGGFGLGESPDAPGQDVRCENIVIEKAVGIELVIRNEENLAAVW
jgi:hypothetical protein